MKNSFKTKGVCSSRIDFDLRDGILSEVKFDKGCDGNLKAIANLVSGMKASDAVGKLKGIDCGGRGTSCADQLARAIEVASANN